MLVTIQSKDNRILKLVRSLAKRKSREREAKFILEGKAAVLEGLCFADKPIFLVARGSFIAGNAGNDILEKANERHVDIYQVTDQLFAGLTQTEEPQGILLVTEKQESNWQELGQNPNPFWVVVDGLQDPGNLGTILRTAAAVGADALIITQDTVDLYNDKSLRSTMGAIFRIKVMQGVMAEDLLTNCERLGMVLVVADPRGHLPYYKWDYTEGMALVIGSEHAGPRPLLLSSAKARITIPMPGQIESLNAGVAAGVLMLEKVRQEAMKINLD